MEGRSMMESHPPPGAPRGTPWIQIRTPSHLISILKPRMKRVSAQGVADVAATWLPHVCSPPQDTTRMGGGRIYPPQHNLKAHPQNTPSKHTLQTHPSSTPSKHTLKAHPWGTPSNEAEFRHMLDIGAHPQIRQNSVICWIW